MGKRRFFSLNGTSESISEDRIELRFDVGAFNGRVFGLHDGVFYECGYHHESGTYMYVIPGGFVRCFSKELFESELNLLCEEERWGT